MIPESLNPSIISLASCSSLLIIGLNYIGDTIFSTPLIHHLASKYPHLKITYVVGGKGGYDILEPDKAIHSLLKSTFTLGDLRQIFRKSPHYPFDGAIILPFSFVSALSVQMMPLSFRVGYDTELRGILLSHSFPRQRSTHRVDEYNRLLHFFNLKEPFPNPKIYLDPKAAEKTTHFIHHIGLEKSKPILIFPFTTRSAKNIPSRTWQILVPLLQKHFPIIIAGAPSDIPLVESLSLQADPSVINLVGKLTLKETAALIALGAGVISGDTGPLHMADALGIPTVSVYGATDPQQTGPYQKGLHRVFYDKLTCSPCFKNQCSHTPRMECVNQHKPLDIISEVLQRFGSNLPYTM